ncbi:unnamed protein product [Prorocentrum cordatum]|uniref:Secreted protein n=1 Tax=Prorocentrum cordatum TaxID=2364126 RepID=A0ABN9SVY2_9DINO|nr:unnamed protein product [Polarella glacialis]
MLSGCGLLFLLRTMQSGLTGEPFFPLRRQSTESNGLARSGPTSGHVGTSTKAGDCGNPPCAGSGMLPCLPGSRLQARAVSWSAEGEAPSQLGRCPRLCGERRRPST